LAGQQDEDYRDRTYVTSIGYLMPQQRWHTWAISAETVDFAGDKMAAAVEEHAVPYLTRVCADDALFLEEVQARSFYSARTTYVIPVVMALQGLVDDAWVYIESRREQVRGIDHAAAREERQAADAVAAWLRDR